MGSRSEGGGEGGGALVVLVDVRRGCVVREARVVEAPAVLSLLVFLVQKYKY